jgi:hypothetical protein
MDWVHGQPQVRVRISRAPQQPGWYVARVEHTWFSVSSGRYGSRSRELAETWVYLPEHMSPTERAAAVLRDALRALEDRLA